MNYNDERKSIEEYFDNNFELPEVKVVYENSPKIDNHELTNVSLLIRDGIANQASMGASSNVYRNNGIVVCEIRSILNKGLGNALEIADHICDIFRSKQFDGITFATSIVDRIGERNGWFQVNVLTSFRRDVIL